MATYTENYNLIKPDEEDYYDVADFNENMDTLDSAMAAAEAAAEEVSAKIGTPAESGQTVFSLLNSGGNSVLKSTQRVTIESPDTRVDIRPVNPAKCFVLTERLYNGLDSLCSYDYILHEDHIEMTVMNQSTGRVSLAFWVVEFY